MYSRKTFEDSTIDTETPPSHAPMANRPNTNDNVWPTRTGKPTGPAGGPRSPVRSGLIKSTVSTVSLTEITHTSFPQPVRHCALATRTTGGTERRPCATGTNPLPVQTTARDCAINLGGLTSSPDHRLRPRPIHVASLHRSSPSLHARSRTRDSMGADTRPYLAVALARLSLGSLLPPAAALRSVQRLELALPTGAAGVGRV